MTFTYNTSDLSLTSYLGHLAQVRLRIGDTDTNDQILQDEEVYYYLDVNSSGVVGASVTAIEAILAKFSRMVDKTVGPFSESLSQRMAGYKSLLATIRRQQATGAYPYAGGISISTKSDEVQNPDRVRPAFYVGMMDNPSNGEGNSSS